jgi:hypothetical protein
MTARVAYAEAGAALRAARARAAAVGLTVLEWQVFAAVAELTTSWSKTTDTTSARQIAAMVYGLDATEVNGGQRRRVRSALEALNTKGVIVLVGARGGRHAGVTVSLPPNTFSREHVFSPGDVDERQRVPATSPTCSGDASNVFPPAGNTEKNSEKISESEPSAQELALIDRMHAHFQQHGFYRHECGNTVAVLKAKGLSDRVLDDVIGRAINAGSTRLSSVTRKAEDWQRRRAGTAP